MGVNPVSSTNQRHREAGENTGNQPRVPRHSAPRGGQLVEQAVEIAVELDSVKLAGEDLPLGVAYRRFLDLVQRAIAFEYGTLYIPDWDSGGLIPVAILGNRVDLAEPVRFARGNGVSAWVAQERRPVVIPDPEQQDNAPIAAGSVRAYLAFPLVQNDLIEGVVALARSNDTFSASEFSRLGRLAESLGTMLYRLRSEARLRELLYVDAQTGLSNHVHFLTRIEEELQRAKQHAGEFTVAVVELDGIETFGRRHDRHEVSQLRQQFTERLQRSMRTCDMAASLEDGRFGLVFAGVNEQTAVTIVQRIASQILTDNLTVPKEQVTMRLRAGLAPSEAFDGSIDECVRRIAGRLEHVA
jgi:diguanylate cyclase (GGDEF)-like protein